MIVACHRLHFQQDTWSILNLEKPFVVTMTPLLRIQLSGGVTSPVLLEQTHTNEAHQ